MANRRFAYKPELPGDVGGASDRGLVNAREFH
jgi:hypothetical protein